MMCSARLALAGRRSNLPQQEHFHADLRLAIEYEPAQQYGGKILASVQAYLHSGDCYQVNLAQRFQATLSAAMNGRHSLQLQCQANQRAV